MAISFNVETRLKQRVIGAIVLVGLAVIVLPMLLDGSAEERARITARIPEPPPIVIDRISVEQVRAEMAMMEADSEANLPELKETPEDIPNSDPRQIQFDENNLPEGWSLQLGSFRNETNALKLRENLRNDLYRAYITRIETAEGETFRVLVGPMLQREKLNKIAEEIESIHQLKGRIVKYRIDEDRGQLGG